VCAEELYLQGNQFTGTIPTQLGFLSKLGEFIGRRAPLSVFLSCQSALTNILLVCFSVSQINFGSTAIRLQAATLVRSMLILA
jgi:hypothetical protein